MAEDLAEELRAGRSLAPSRGRTMALCALLSLSGGLLWAISDEGDFAANISGSIIVAGGAVMCVVFALGWTVRRAVWLAREGIVFEKPDFRYHVPWDEVAVVNVAGWSVLKRVQVKVHDVEAVVATVRRKRRGGKLKAEKYVRRLLNLNQRVGEQCHFEFMASGIGVDAEALREALATYMADAGKRGELKPLPGLKDSPDADG